MTHGFNIRLATDEDLRALTAPGGLGDQFFAESEFGTFTEFDRHRLADLLASPVVKNQELIVLIGTHDGDLVGMLMFSVTRLYTKDPLAQLFLFYVARRRRLSPLGRALLRAAESVAKEMGAVVFYAGATANVSPEVDGRLMNMLDKEGYHRLGGVSRKILGGD